MNSYLVNIDAEMSVLGGLMLEPERIDQVAGMLGPEDFTEGKHRAVFEAILGLRRRGIPADPVTLADVMPEQSVATLLAELMDFVPTAANISYYARLVKDASRRRRLVEVGRKISQEAVDTESVSDALDQAEAAVLGLREGSSEYTGPIGVGKALGSTIKELERRCQAGGEITGVSTGFPDLDRMTAGLHPGDLIIVAGRPSMGKTALALDMTRAAAQTGHRTLVFSLEMGQDLLVSRLLSVLAKVNSHQLRRGELKDEDWKSIRRESENLHRLPILIDDTTSQTVFDLRAKARRVKRDGGLDLIVIDYLQLMKPAKAHQQREREVAEISRALKGLARELNVPIVVLSQLNRGVETGAKPRRPLPSDLRESGSLEQDADLIIFPWRESVYCQKCRAKNNDCGERHFRSAEIIIGKQRNGQIGTVLVPWIPELTTFRPE